MVLVWCRDVAALYGSLLTFKTLRVGFPDDEVIVVDNGSIEVPDIRAAAEAVGARYFRQDEMPHWQFVRKSIEAARGPVVFADPDLIFWERMELPDALIAGRFIPTFFDEYTQTVTHARLHTSLLSIPDPEQLWRIIGEQEARMFEANLLRPVMVPRDGKWERWDTGAALYGAIGGHHFTTQLDSYDHLFCGSNMSAVAGRLAPEVRDEFARTHALARAGELADLRGIWKRQQQHFEERGLYA